MGEGIFSSSTPKTTSRIILLIHNYLLINELKRIIFFGGFIKSKQILKSLHILTYLSTNSSLIHKLCTEYLRLKNRLL
jgi:hypothetical protein